LGVVSRLRPSGGKSPDLRWWFHDLGDYTNGVNNIVTKKFPWSLNPTNPNFGQIPSKRSAPAGQLVCSKYFNECWLRPSGATGLSLTLFRRTIRNKNKTPSQKAFFFLKPNQSTPIPQITKQIIVNPHQY
jgi:hypothetical protein